MIPVVAGLGAALAVFWVLFLTRPLRKRRGHKVKVLKAVDGRLVLLVDGIHYTFLLDRPAPLTHLESTALRAVLDTNLLMALTRDVTAMGGQRSGRSLMTKIIGNVWHGRSTDIPLPSTKLSISEHSREGVSDYLERMGTELELEDGVKVIVITRGDIDRIRKGDIW